MPNSAQRLEKGSYRMLNFTVPHLLHWPREGSGCAAGGVGLARSHRGMVATQMLPWLHPLKSWSLQQSRGG